MTKPRVYRTQEVELENFDFPDKVTVNSQTQQKTVKGVTYAGKQFFLQTPRMFNAWGLDVSQQKNEAGEPMGNPAYYVRLSFGKEPVATTAKFRTLMYDMEDILKQACKDHCVKWLGEKPDDVDDDVLNNTVAQLVNQSVNKETMEPDNEWPDNIRFRLPFVPVDAKDKDGNLQENAGTFPDYLEVYDENNERINIESVEDMQNILTRGTEVQAIVALSGLYISGKVGYTYRVRHLQVFPSKGGSTMTGYVIRNDNDDLSDEEEV
jgi:hypothetical protein